uniref:Mannosidase endo-alpha n=1 Tax=Clastoptera arizonana TaxID=38151 RepID=A0A1B6DUQ7_9HEMI
MLVFLRRGLLYLKKYFFVIFFNIIIFYMLDIAINYSKTKPTSPTPLAANHIISINPNNIKSANKDTKHKTYFKTKSKVFDNNFVKPHIPSIGELRLKWISEKVNRISSNMKKSNNYKLRKLKSLKKPNKNVHIFYYSWYTNLKDDGNWSHWDHEYLPSWRNENIKHLSLHQPPHDIGSNYYPLLGCYSSKNASIITTHMKQIRNAGIGVIIVSWDPYEDASDKLLKQLLNIAQDHELYVALHILSYRDRSPKNLYTYIHYITNHYVPHPAYLKLSKNGKLLPVYYIYDSFLHPASEWKELLSIKGNISIRGSKYDGFFIGQLVDIHHRYEIKKSNFDGFYTYSACNGLSYGSTWKNWKKLRSFAKQNKLEFIPSVGPGFIDVAVRPWNNRNIRHRRHGNYYDVAWRSALNSQPTIISITSFNEWHEGTQIEPAIPKKNAEFTYFDYEPEGPLFYLNLTKWWILRFTNIPL